MYTEILNLTSLRGVAGATIDLSEDCLNMCVNLTLAQGQACVYEKAVRGRTVEGKGVKPSVLAKIAQSAGDFYAFSLKSAKSKGVGKKLDGSWENNLNSQAMHFYATAQYWESVNMRDVAKSTGSGYGVEIGEIGQGAKDGRLERSDSKSIISPSYITRLWRSDNMNNIPYRLFSRNSFSSSLRSSHITPTRITNDLLLITSLLARRSSQLV